MALACGPKPGGDSDGGSATEASSTSGSSTTSGSSATSGLSSTTDPMPEELCGNGVIDPGEECDDGGGGCDACTEQCTLPVEPAVEWSVALAPIVEVFDVDVTQQGRAWVLGETAEGAHVLQRIEGAALAGSVDLAALGVAEVLAFHVNGAAVDGVEVGVLAELTDASLVALRIGVDGLVGEPVSVAKEGLGLSPSVAVHSLGVTVGGSDGARTLSPTGELVATIEGSARAIDALGDRLVFTGSRVVLVGPDGSDRVETMCVGDYLTTAGTHVVEYFIDLTGGGVSMYSCELATGEQHGGVVASGGNGSLEAGPLAEVQDAAANGNPLGYWRLCPFMADDPLDCGDAWEAGFGGPGDPHVVELDDCDMPQQARVGLDRGVLMLRRDRTTGAVSLVRRATLPDAPPWA